VQRRRLVCWRLNQANGSHKAIIHEVSAVSSTLPAKALAVELENTCSQKGGLAPALDVFFPQPLLPARRSRSSSFPLRCTPQDSRPACCPYRSPVAGNHQRHSIAGTGASDGAHRAGPANATRNFAVRTGAAVGDFFKRSPQPATETQSPECPAADQGEVVGREVFENRAKLNFSAAIIALPCVRSAGIFHSQARFPLHIRFAQRDRQTPFGVAATANGPAENRKPCS